MESVALGLPKNQEFPLDANGVPIKPGYRRPFTSETARKAQMNSASVRKANGLNAKLQRDSRIIYEVLNQVRIMLENRRKRGSKPHLDGNHGVATRDSKPTPISPTITPRPSDQSASQVKPEGIKPAPIPKAAPIVSPKVVARAAPETATPVEDDCPF